MINKKSSQFIINKKTHKYSIQLVLLSTVSRLADKGFIHRVKLRLDSVSFIKALEKLKYEPKSFTNRILPIQTYHGSKTEQRIESHFITHLFQSSYRLISRHQHLSHIISVCNDGNTRIYINVQTKATTRTCTT